MPDQRKSRGPTQHSPPAAHASDASVQGKVARDQQLLIEAHRRGKLATLGVFARLSGPGWLQSAITLGGGSLAGSLYLGVLGGFSLLWLQPLAMMLGVVMLSAISYVTLSTVERPFQAINRHINPLLGWGWILATMAANIVWSLPQYSLATAAIRQNLLPGLFANMDDALGRWIVSGSIAVVCILVVRYYNCGAGGIRIFEAFLKCLVALVVVSFLGVVAKMSLSPQGGLNWSAVAAGLVPDPGMLTKPAATFTPYLRVVEEPFRSFWTQLIVKQQRDVMIAAAATAVGINMTFLLPYSMLRRGWDKHFRGLAIFDLALGLFIPFALTTSCVLIASAAQFHTRPASGLLEQASSQGALLRAEKDSLAKFNRVIDSRLRFQLTPEAWTNLSEQQRAQHRRQLPQADKHMAAMLVQRDAFDLAQSLAPLTGTVVAHYVFGLGVVGMAVSTAIVLMLINGFVLTEMFDAPPGGWAHRVGSLMPVVGVLGPFIYSGKTQFWLAVPTSVFAMILIPIAYFAFMFMLNQKTLLGNEMPRGLRRLVWNLLLVPTAVLTGLASLWCLWSKIGRLGIALMVLFIVLAVLVHFVRKLRNSKTSPIQIVNTRRTNDANRRTTTKM